MPIHLLELGRQRLLLHGFIGNSQNVPLKVPKQLQTSESKLMFKFYNNHFCFNLLTLLDFVTEHDPPLRQG